MNSLSNSKVSFDVIILTETWINESTARLCNINGYKSYHSFCTSREGGGVSVFVRHNINCQVLSIGVNDDNIECVGVKIFNKRSGGPLHLFGIYRPPAGKLQEFNNKLEEILSSSTKNNTSVMIAGDLNICISNKNSLNLIDDFTNLLMSNYFRPLITLPTRIHNNSATILDQIWINFPSLSFSGVVDVDLTDHFPVFSIVSNVNCIKNKLLNVKFRDFSSHNYELLDAELNKVNWTDLLGKVSCPEELTKCFLDKLHLIYDKCFPIKTKRIGIKRIINAWLTPSLLRAIRLKHDQYKQVKGGTLDKNSYLRYCKILSKLIKQNKKVYHEELFTGIKNDMKKTWEIINKTLNNNPNYSKNIKLKLNNEFIEDKDVPNVFNYNFVNVGSNLHRQIQGDANINFTQFMPTAIEESFFLYPSTSIEVQNVLNKLKNKKNTIKHMGTKIYKMYKNCLAEPISFIFNKIVESGSYPQTLKTAYVTQIYKTGDKNNPLNYRPISCLSILNIIFEKLLYARLNNFIKNKKILNDNQFGFREGHNTSDAVYKLLNKAYNALNNKKYFGVVSLDLKKAFDTVDHSILLTKLSYYGFRGKILDILTSYLSNRKQIVKVNGCISEELPLTVGVPQGSVLGPLLFLLYINDLPLIMERSDALVYADDTTVALADSDVYQLCEDLSSDLDVVDEWLKANLLTLNLNKTTYTIITLSDTPENLKVTINKTEVNYSKEFKFLGVIIDDNLSFKNHIKEISKKISKSVGIISKMTFLPSFVLKSLYYSLIYPYLTYCILAWGSIYRTTLNPIIILQKRIVRLINGSSYYAHTHEIFNNLSMLKFEYLFKYNCALYMYDIINLKKALYMHEQLMDNQTNFGYLLRNSSALRQPFIRVQKYKQCLIYQLTQIWNSLPYKIKLLPSKNIFRKNLLTFFLDNQKN